LHDARLPIATVCVYEGIKRSAGYELPAMLAETDLELALGTGQSVGEQCMRLIAFDAAATDG
jgi:hypothetical protein